MDFSLMCFGGAKQLQLRNFSPRRVGNLVRNGTKEGEESRPEFDASAVAQSGFACNALRQGLSLSRFGIQRRIGSRKVRCSKEFGSGI